MKKGLMMVGAVIIASLLFASCGGSTASKNATPNADSTEIESDSTAMVDSAQVDAGETDNVDALLKSYETYIDKYIALLKKAKKGDASALADYPAMMESANDLQTKLEKAGEQLTPKQMEKFLDLQKKLMKAASEM